MASPCAVLCDPQNEEFIFTALGTWFYLGVESLPEEPETSELWVDIWESLLDAPELLLQTLSQCAPWDWAGEEPPWIFLHPSTTEARLVREK